MQSRFGVAACLAFAFPIMVFGQGGYPVPVGQQHPDFRLPNVEDQKPIALSDYRGKKVLLVHFASW